MNDGNGNLAALRTATVDVAINYANANLIKTDQIDPFSWDMNFHETACRRRLHTRHVCVGNGMSASRHRCEYRRTTSRRQGTTTLMSHVLSS
jgi:hypothetical protein